jgi:hypothetical protein
LGGARSFVARLMCRVDTPAGRRAALMETTPSTADKREVRSNGKEWQVPRAFVARKMEPDDKPEAACYGLDFGLDCPRYSETFSSRPSVISGLPHLEIPAAQSLRYTEIRSPGL